MKAREGGRERGPDDAEYAAEGGALVVLCTKCRLRPVPSSEECVRCMVRCMSLSGGTDRVILRTGTDTEISGASCRAIRSAASLMGWTSGGTEGMERRCRSCPASRREVMGAVWSRFPGDGVPAGRALLSSAPQEPGCMECAMRTSRSLDMLERRMAEIVDGMGWPR